MTRAKRSKSEMRLIRSATAYRRLAWKRTTNIAQARAYNATADRLMAQADRIRRDREARA